jgi:ribitol-5-phosphate 2-dehydrogenase (NADP+) / D-ribitol-5-phosphate cytidylyltransferase
VRTIAAVIAAPGGELPGPGAPPPLAPPPLAPQALALLAGRAVIEHSVAALQAVPQVDEILVAAPPPLAARVRTLLAAGGYRKVSRVIEGGATRTESAWRVIRALGGADASLLLHDAARPLVSPRVIADCAAALGTYQAVCAVVPASDTMVAVRNGLITERPPRDRLRRRQTPQGFRLAVIRRGYELALADPGFRPADDCGIVLRYLPEVPVRLVPGSERSFAITRPADLAIAETLAGAAWP